MARTYRYLHGVLTALLRPHGVHNITRQDQWLHVGDLNCWYFTLRGYVPLGRNGALFVIGVLARLRSVYIRQSMWDIWTHCVCVYRYEVEF